MLFKLYEIMNITFLGLKGCGWKRLGVKGNIHNQSQTWNMCKETSPIKFLIHQKEKKKKRRKNSKKWKGDDKEKSSLLPLLGTSRGGPEAIHPKGHHPILILLNWRGRSPIHPIEKSSLLPLPGTNRVGLGAIHYVPQRSPFHPHSSVAIPSILNTIMHIIKLIRIRCRRSM